jgi:hypothetical protein
MRLLILSTLLAALAGCAAGRYQMEAIDNTVYRLDTQTGSLEACGWEAGQPVCKPFPAPAPTK